MQDIKIGPQTPLESIRKAGLVRDRMAEECEEHGMYEAENILFEWDWEDGCDLGDGYDKDQLEVHANVRGIIHDALGY